MNTEVVTTAKMNTENTSTEGLPDIKVENESDDEVESEINLYADHEIKEEMVIGPVVLQRVVNATNYCEDVPTPKKPRLEVKDEKTDQVKPHQKEIIEDNTVEIVSNVIKKKRKKVGNKEQTKCYNPQTYYNPTPGISGDEVESEINLYADHEIKEEMVIGPVVLQQAVNATDYYEGLQDRLPTPKKPRLEVKDEKTDQVEPHQKEIIEDNTVEIVSHIIKKKRKKVGNKEQTKCYNPRTYYNPTPGISGDEVESEINLYADHEIKEEMVIGPVVLQRVVNATDYYEDVSARKNPRLEGNEKKTDQVKSQKEKKKNNAEEIKSSVEIKKKKKKLKNKEHAKRYNLRKYNQTPGISQNVFICNDCGKKYRKKCELVQHIVCHEKIKQDNNYKCKECTYQTGSQEALEQHYKLHDIDRSFICDLCGYRSDNKYKLLKHFKSKHYLLNEDSKKKALLCSVCGQKCKRKSSLLIHLRSHTGEKPYSCSECGFKCASKSNLIRHLRIHTKSYSCSECEFKCGCEKDLTIHFRTHTGEKPYSCSECEYKCTSKSNLTSHLRVHTKPYSCSECKYRCARKKDLTIHTRTHTGEKPYSCSECEYKCAHKTSLRTHLHTHIDEEFKPKPYSCATCKYKFARKDNLISHIRTHTGEKAYSCSKCEYKCKSRIGLVSHSYIHTGEKPYACSQCAYKSVMKSHLTLHLRTHSGEKPYACSECDYKCANKSHLITHLRTSHTGEKKH